MHGPSPACFSFIFVFSKKHYNSYNTKNVKIPSNIQCWESNPRHLEHVSPPITTRPVFPLFKLFILLILDMGYEESQFSMPRWLDLSYSRQGMFDDTYHYIPSQGWMFLPLVVYQGGGDAAKFEPLSQNIKVTLLNMLLMATQCHIIFYSISAQMSFFKLNNKIPMIFIWNHNDTYINIKMANHCFCISVTGSSGFHIFKYFCFEKG